MSGERCDRGAYMRSTSSGAIWGARNCDHSYLGIDRDLRPRKADGMVQPHQRRPVDQSVSSLKWEMPGRFCSAAVSLAF